MFEKNRLTKATIDAGIISLALALAYLIRFDFALPWEHFWPLLKAWPFFLLAKVPMFFVFELDRPIWRYVSLHDLLNIVKAASAGSALVGVLLFLFNRFQDCPRSIFVLDAILTVIGLCLARLAVRLYHAQKSPPAKVKDLEGPKTDFLIVGAGKAGEMVLREIKENKRHGFNPVGLLDDDPHKHGKTIHGTPILGGVDQLTSLEQNFDLILIAIPSASAEQMRRIVELCRQTGKAFQTLPALTEILEGAAPATRRRPVRIEDILGREKVSLSKEKIADYLHQKRVLVTGAGGSIGSELVRQIRRFMPEALGLLDVSEYNLFRVEGLCRRDNLNIAVHSFLADIKNKARLRKIFQKMNPQVIFHAAAYKHVPIQEAAPWEAVENNVWGTINVIEAALEAGVERFVFVSSDKAVKPSSVMGATKRLAEQIISSINSETPTKFMAVRFGNVMGSSGSVIPIFQEQIDRGGPVTVTHPDVTRYFMTIGEACQLILQAGALGEGGEIFILDMGQPIRIAALAEDMIRLSGLDPGRDVKINYIGLRPGEKLHEELACPHETPQPTIHEKITFVRGEKIDHEALMPRIEELLTVARTYDALAIKKKIKALVPDYSF